MSAYHQMGHDSENLLWEPELGGFRGAILSPVNYEMQKISSQIVWAREQENFTSIFDPQLYVPNSERETLREWPYFPADVDTADRSSEAWWNTVLDSIVDVCAEIRPTAVCSPAVLPSTYPDEYFATLVTVGDQLASRLRGTSIRAIQTAVVALPEISAPGRAMTLASILSRSRTGVVYLVLVSQIEPRRELMEVEELKGAMRLISALRDAGIEVIVGFSSSDVILWKAAGASHCATGKFFNLRRFTRTRFDEPPGSGGGQLPYWFEESILSFLRQSDIARVLPLDLPRLGTSTNPFENRILSQIAEDPSRAWLAIAWRQFMRWFSDVEERIGTNRIDAAALLRNADNNWTVLDTADVFMEERKNKGDWIRPWRRALAEYRTA